MVLSLLPESQNQQGLIGLLSSAIKTLAAEKTDATVNQLKAAQDQVRALLRSGRLSSENALRLLGLIDSVIDDLE